MVIEAGDDRFVGIGGSDSFQFLLFVMLRSILVCSFLVLPPIVVNSSLMTAKLKNEYGECCSLFHFSSDGL